jgi:hypothetical protein
VEQSSPTAVATEHEIGSSVEDHSAALRSEASTVHNKSHPSAITSCSGKLPTAMSVVPQFKVLSIESSVEGHDGPTNSESEQAASLYQYSPLLGASEIRLVILEPGRDDDPIKYRLVYVSLDENPVYEALLYT